jgi:hypothetical protein
MKLLLTMYGDEAEKEGESKMRRKFNLDFRKSI